MRRIDVWALSFRARVAQPVADALVTRLRTNCFVGAAWCLLASAATVAAVDAHGIVTDEWLAVITMADLVWVAILTGLATHLVRFQRAADVRHFRVTHPVFRTGHRTAFLLVTAFGLNVVVGVAAAVLSRDGISMAAWHVARCGQLWPMAVGLSLATCEWRRLPPARRREDVQLRDAAA